MNKRNPYKFLPIFFLFGAGIEWFMINVRVGKETFCKFSFNMSLVNVINMSLVNVINMSLVNVINMSLVNVINSK